MDYEKLLNLAIELGYQLMASGGEIYRVEESTYRLLKAYGLVAPEVFAIPNCLIISITTPQGHPVTQMRRIPNHGTDIELLERCNALCRHLCTHPVPLAEAFAQVKDLAAQTPRHDTRLALLGYFLVPAFFSPLLGGDLFDGLAAGMAGLVIGFLLIYARRLLGENAFLRTALCSALASLICLFLVRMGIGHNVDQATIGVLMVLVPGMALTTAMREIMVGDIVSGLSRTAEALLIGTAIALGAVAALALGQVL